MSYAIIGSGNIGSAVAGHFARTGIDVAVAASRGAETVAPLAQRLGSHVVP
ncbi:NAD(P)-binding domain-containing protein [Mycobacterium sp. C3-094]